MKGLAKYNKVYLVAISREQDIVLDELKEYCERIEVVYKPDIDAGIFQRATRLLEGLCSPLSKFLRPYKSAEMQKKINDIISNNFIDIVQMESVYAGIYNFSKSINRNLKTVLVQHNLEYKLIWQFYIMKCGALRKTINYFEWLKFRRVELNKMQEVDMCVFMSEADRASAQKLLGDRKNMIVVPNGVDTSYISPVYEGRTEGVLLFTGLLSYLPNDDAVVWFADEILPLIKKDFPAIKVFVVGKDPSQRVLGKGRDDKGLVITGFVPDVRDYLYQGAIFICPLRLGSGTRLKLLEAMAAGIPIVSTTVGCEGIEFEPGHNIIIADSPEKFAEGIAGLLCNEDKRHKMAMEARSLAEKQYSWDYIALNYHQALMGLISG